MIGKTLGHYEITGRLGRGGMGEVYRARDTRLGRDVAIKVLPESLSNNASLRARLEREAKTISSLNSPYICVLYDVGREGDVDFLVMELVEGITLADRLQEGPLPLPEVLKYGAQIADALDRAHRAGVIHRDLKPGNVMLARSGAKLMDFGLARVVEAVAPGAEDAATIPSPDPSRSLTHPLTAEGSIVGTFQYMAPEQLEGKEVDACADLWALGCVLHEMATGKPAFSGKSQASLIGAIMQAEPPPASSLAPLAPLEFDRLVKACLVKDRQDRIQSAHDVKLQLEWMRESGDSRAEGRPSGWPSPSRRPRWPSYALTALVTALLVVLVMLALPGGGGQSAGDRRPQRYILGSADLQLSSTPIFTRDGKAVIFSGRNETTHQLYRRDLSSFETTPIEGTEGGSGPFPSPDGAWIGFGTSDALKKVPVGGGLAQVIVSPGTRIQGATWCQDGTIYFCLDSGGVNGAPALERIPAGGGPVEVVARLDSTTGDYDAWAPEALPDGKTVLFNVISSAYRSRVVAVLPDGKRKTVVERGFYARYAPPGYLLYYDQSSEAVLVAPFDAKEVRVTGPAVPLTKRIDVMNCFDVSRDGKLVYVPLPTNAEGAEVVLLDRTGQVTHLCDQRASWTQPRVSPDGKHVLLRKIEMNCELWLLDIAQGSLVRIAQGHDNHDPIWSPDGTRVAYRQLGSPEKLMTLSVTGPRESRVIEQGATAGSPGSWSSGNDLLVYTVAGTGTRHDIWVRPMVKGGKARAFLATKHDERQPAISPDGKWIAYVSDDTGLDEIYLRSYPDRGSVWQITSGPGTWPEWSRDGHTLYFVSGNKLMSVSFSETPSISIGTPRLVLPSGFGNFDRQDYDVTPDGQFVVVRSAQSAKGGKEMRLLLNWQEEMKRLSGSTQSSAHPAEHS